MGSRGLVRQVRIGRCCRSIRPAADLCAMQLLKYIFPALILILFGSTLRSADSDFRAWTLEEAAEVLNRSSWSQQETFTRIVGGIGSGIQGEKEIYSTYFVRLLSARPIRQAYARIRQIQLGYDALDRVGKARIDADLQRILDLDLAEWIVVSVAFRCNEPREESRIERFFANGTTETNRNRAYLSTSRHPRILLTAYFAPTEPAVGARFVFPRTIGGEPVVGSEDKEVVFELDTPSSNIDLKVAFPVSELQLDGRLEL